MGHRVHAFLFRGAVNPGAIGELPSAVACQLPQGISAIALLPYVLDETDALSDGRPGDPAAGEPGMAFPHSFIYLDSALLAWAERVADGDAFAYIETDYFGGAGTQGAALWQAGNLVLPESGRDAPVLINEVLDYLGVAPGDDDEDAFEAIGLHVMRSDEDFAETFEARLLRFYGHRIVGRYLGPDGFVEVRITGDQLGRWDERHQALIPWQITPSGKFVETATGTCYAVEQERSGTPRLVRQGIRPGSRRRMVLCYNDGPHLVHDPARETWAEHVGSYLDKSGQRITVSRHKKQLYINEVRLLPVVQDSWQDGWSDDWAAAFERGPGNDGLHDHRFVTAAGDSVELAAGTLSYRGASYGRVRTS